MDKFVRKKSPNSSINCLVGQQKEILKTFNRKPSLFENLYCIKLMLNPKKV